MREIWTVRSGPLWKTPIFITNIHRDTMETGLIEYIKKQNAGNRVLGENLYKKAHQ